MVTSESRALWFVVAFLVSVIAGLVVGFLASDKGARKAILCGLAAFGGTLVGTVTIETQLGLV
jgi:hypothetical protein